MDRPIYFNVIRSYLQPLKRCIELSHWIKHQGKFISPYEFAYKFGVSWLLNGYEFETKSPYDVLQEGLDIVQQKKESGASAEEIERLTARCLEFKNKIDAYYREGWDQRLKMSMETGRWV